MRPAIEKGRHGGKGVVAASLHDCQIACDGSLERGTAGIRGSGTDGSVELEDMVDTV